MKLLFLSIAVGAALGGTVLISQEEVDMATFYYVVGCFVLLLRNAWESNKE